MKEFTNEVYYDFTDSKIAKKQRAAIDDARAKFGKEYPNIINGRKVKTTRKTTSYSPANPEEVVGVFQKSGKDDAEKAMKSAAKAFEEWKNVPTKKRADVLFKAANIIRRRRMEINAWMVSEVGKNYLEADADTCEAIDFLDFYAREALRYAEGHPLTPQPGEKNELGYIPLGVGVVIPPWNFPFAILLGMTAAAIVCGNTVVLKPSSDSPMMGWLASEILFEAGVPKGVLNFLVASGSEAGDYLVEHPTTRFISFTGSMEVGLRINELAAKMSKGQIWIKRVIAEMGGKDSIIVAGDANIDEAVKGVVASAFGFQGQKCSACSRAIVDAKIYDEFVAKLKVAVDELEIGEPMDDVYMGPVINEGAMKTIQKYMRIGKKEGKLIAGGGRVRGKKGYFLEPTVFVNVKPKGTPHAGRDLWTCTCSLQGKELR